MQIIPNLIETYHYIIGKDVCKEIIHIYELAEIFYKVEIIQMLNGDKSCSYWKNLESARLQANRLIKTNWKYGKKVKY